MFNDNLIILLPHDVQNYDPSDFVAFVNRLSIFPYFSFPFIALDTPLQSEVNISFECTTRFGANVL